MIKILLMILVITLINSIQAREYVRTNVLGAPPERTNEESDVVIKGNLGEPLSIRELNIETGVYDRNFSLTDDISRLTVEVRAHAAISPLQDSKILSATYGTLHKNAWWEFLVAKGNGTFGSFTDNSDHPSTQNKNAEGNYQRTRESQVSLLTIGAGFTNRYGLTRELFGNDHFFDFVSVYLTYNKFNDEFRGQIYSGPGLLTSYAISYRKVYGMEWGPKFTYELASVKRQALSDNERSGDRSLLLSAVSFGVNATFYWGRE